MCKIILSVILYIILSFLPAQSELRHEYAEC